MATATTLPTLSDNLGRYLAEIRRYPLLSKEEEYMLARRWTEHQDREAAHRLVTANLRFVVKIAMEYRGYGLRMLDLIQEGNVGLMQAVKRFDPDRGYRLITYAVWWIRAYIQNFIVSSWSMIRMGTTRAQRKLFFKLGQLKRTFRQGEDISEADTTAAVAEKLQLDEAEVEEVAQRLAARDLSLDAVWDEESRPMIETIPTAEPDQETLLADRESDHLVTSRVQHALEELDERERRIIEARYLASETATLRDLGEEMNLSRERVRQIENRAKAKLREALGDGELLAIAQAAA